MLAQFAKRLGRRDDRKRVEIARQRTDTKLVGSVGGVAVFFLLVKIGFVHRRGAITAALRARARCVGFDLVVLAVATFIMAFGDQFYLIALTLIAQEQHLAAIGNKDECVVR